LVTPDLAGNNLIQQLLDRVNLVELISRDVKLRHNGRNWVGLCPFHSDSAPSFSVSQEKGLYHCFGCKEGGNALTYVKKTRGLTAGDAIEELARFAGVERPADWRGNAEVYREKKEKRDLMFECNDAAQLWFASRLRAPEAQAARDYLTQRGLDRDSIIQFGIGFAPLEGGLRDVLSTKGLSIAAAIEAGLLRRYQDSNAVAEPFRNRITFPIRNPNGRIAGFSARTMDAEAKAAKYIISSDSEVYQKGSLLYGFWEAREGIRHRGGAILVEGQMDVIAMHRAGFVNTVAPLGTALTRQQLQILRRLGDSVTVLFDGDGAGRKAARRAVGMLLEEGLNGRVANPPDKADPDSILKTQGAPALQALVDAAMPALEWLVKQLASQHDGSIAGRSKAMREGLDWAKLIQDDIERGQFTEELGRTLGISSEALRKSGSPTRRAGQSSPAAPTPGQNGADAVPVDGTQLDLLAALVIHPQLLRRVLDQVPDLPNLFQESVVALLLGMNEVLEEEGKLDVGLLLEQAQGELRAALGARVMDGPEFSEAEAASLVDAKIGKLKRDQATQQRDSILAQMRKAQASGDTGTVEKLATELDSVKKSIRSAAGLACD
jgi:DNA primase